MNGPTEPRSPTGPGPRPPAGSGTPAGPGAPAGSATPAGPEASYGSGWPADGPWAPGGRGRSGPFWGGFGGPPGRSPRARRNGGRGPSLRLPFAIAVVQLIGSTGAAHFHPATDRPLAHLGYLLLLAGPLVLVARRRWRVATLAVVLAVTLAYYLLNYPYGPAFLAGLAAVLGTVRAGHRLATQVLCAVGYAVYVTAGRVLPDAGLRTPSLGNALALAAWLVVVLALAEGIRVRSAQLAEISRARAEQARARAEQQRHQASEERLRIARELHDVLGHHLSLINVQAGVGLHLMDERPEQARTSLLAIKQASAEALREVRSVLGVLRPEDEAAPRAPAPSLENLSTLVEGSGTEVIVTGTARALPAELDRAAYRIVQEALTNVRRHAGGRARATVTIGYGERGLSVRVEDDGTGGVARGDGNGIAGMRARAAALGGTLTAGPGPAGGFRVEADLPWESS